MNQRPLYSCLSFLALAILLAFGVACADDPTAGTAAQLRAIHLSPDAPAVDVYVDEGATPAFAGLTFTTGSPYAELPAGAYRLDVAAAGSAVSEAVLTVNSAELEAGTSYTAVAYGNLASIQPLLLKDMNDVPSTSVAIRPVHVADGAGPVDILSDSGNVLVDGLRYGQAGAALMLPSAEAEIGVDLDRDGSSDADFVIPVLSPGTAVNLFAVLDGAGSLALLAQLPDGSVRRLESVQVALPPGQGAVRALHLSPDAPNVDVFVDGGTAPAFADFPFGTGTRFAELPVGSYDFAVSAAGATAADAVLEIDNFTVADQTYSTLVAFDELSMIQPLALEDDFSAPDAGKIRIRPVHTAVGVGTVDIYAVSADGTSVPLSLDVDFGTAADALEVDAGAYTLGVDANEDGIVDLVFTLPSLVAGTIANVFAAADTSGDIFLLAQLGDGNTLRIDASTPTFEQGQVRVVHLGPDAPNVDVFLNGAETPAVAGLEFEMGTASLSLPVGTYRIDVTVSGMPASEAVITVENFQIIAGQTRTVVAYDRLANTIKALAIDEDLTAPAPGNIRVRAIHVAANLREVDVYNVPNRGLPTILSQNVGFGAAGENLEIPAGAYTIGIDVDNDSVIDEQFDLPALPAGTIANVYAVSDLFNVFLIAQFADGSTARIDG